MTIAFLWPQAVSFWPPAHILQNYDVVLDGGAPQTKGLAMPKSSSWSVTLAAAVADQATVAVPTPGLDVDVIDLNSAELAVDNKEVVIPAEATVDFGDGSTATVTNLTGQEWPQGAVVYLYVAAKAVSGEDLEDQLAAMQTQIDANASDIAALEPTVEQNAAAIVDLQARVSALETVAPPAQRQ
jgi:hypothetical protein